MIYTVFSTTITLWVIAVVLVFYAVLWVVLTLDTLRLVRLVKTAPSARAGVAALAAVAMVLVSGTAAYGAYLATTTSGFLSSVFVAGPSEPPIDGRYNVLLLGGDAGPDRDGLRPDSIRVVSIDAGDRPGRHDRPAAQHGGRPVRRRLADAGRSTPRATAPSTAARSTSASSTRSTPRSS